MMTIKVGIIGVVVLRKWQAKVENVEMIAF